MKLIRLKANQVATGKPVCLTAECSDEMAADITAIQPWMEKKLTEAFGPCTDFKYEAIDPPLV